MMKKQKQKQKQQDQEKTLLPACPETGCLGSLAVELARFIYPEEIWDAKDVQFLAKGGEGSVFKVKRTLQGQDPIYEVLKIITLSIGKKFGDITREYRILKGIESKGIHPNVIQPIGDLIEGSKERVKLPSVGYCAYFMPFFSHSLCSLLHPEESVSRSRSDAYIELSFSERIGILIAVANAVHYLHSNFVIHRDIKPENIFLEFVRNPDGVVAELKVVLGDFGCAGIFIGKDKTIDLAKAIGSPVYMAPETRPVSGDPIYSQKTDAFSFGLLMWAIMTNETPFSKLGRSADIPTLVDKGVRPDKGSEELLESLKKELGDACFSEYYELMRSCWDGNREARPSFGDICNKLRRIEGEYLRHQERSTMIIPLAQQPSVQSKTIRHKRAGSRVRTLTDAEYAKLLGPRLFGLPDHSIAREGCAAAASPLSAAGWKPQQEPSSSVQAAVSDEVKSSRVLTLSELSDALRDMLREKGKIVLDTSNMEGFLRDLGERLPSTSSSVAASSSSLHVVTPQVAQRDEANTRQIEVSSEPRVRAQTVTSISSIDEGMHRPHASVLGLGRGPTIFSSEAGSRGAVIIPPSTFFGIDKVSN